MKASMRYSLIAAFFLAFFILAPLIVLFVTGTEYDFKNHSFVKTGTLSIQTQPKRAEVYLNAKLADATPSTIRFLTPGDYNVLIKKEGYFDWSKRLTVNAQYVTFASSNTKSVTLFFSKPSAEKIKDGVVNFFTGSKRILYLTADALYLGNISSPTETQQLKLPDAFVAQSTTQAAPAASAIQITASPDENYFLLSNANFAAVFDTARNTITDISAVVAPGLDAEKQIQFSPDNKLYYLSKGVLYQIDWQGGTKKIVLQNVLSFFATENIIYFISPSAISSAAAPSLSNPSETLFQAQIPTLDRSQLISGLPNWANSKIYLSAQNQIFIVADSSLYAVANNIARVADFVENIKIFSQLGLVMYSTNNEIGIYDYLNGNGANSRNQTVTRSSSEIKNPVAFPDLGWIFFENNGQLRNIEIDNRDHQNNYTFANLSANAKFFVDSGAENIFLLDNGNLSRLTIR
jgi:hypothetical protein